MSERIGLMLHTSPGPGVLHELTGVFRAHASDVLSVEIIDGGGTAPRVYFELAAPPDVDRMLDELRALPSVRSLERVNTLQSVYGKRVIIMGGGALVNMSYCLIRLAAVKKLSLRADLAQPGPVLMRNAALAATGGIMWYLQFFFYAWGAANIPQSMSYVNWMLHMSIYVLCGGIVGLALGEWKGVRGRPLQLLCAGIVIIIVAANLVGLGMKS